MCTSFGGWIHNFTVTDTQTHTNGYTVYKITSIVFPRSTPQALTCLVVWKRFHDIKRLHREIKQKFKSLKLPGQLPEIENCNYFKRFDAEVIQRRKKFILQLLDFAAQYPPLYTCHAFEQFFSDINLINKSPSKGFISVNQNLKNVTKKFLNFDNDKVDYDQQQDLEIKQEIKKSKSVVNNVESKEECSKHDTSSVLTPVFSMKDYDGDYIYKAALEFSHAVQAEANLNYHDASLRYKCGIEILQDGSKEDVDEERRLVAKAKIAKYLCRAKDIDEQLLADPQLLSHLTMKTNVELVVDFPGNNNSATLISLEQPWNHLAQYKVINIFGEKVLLVSCVNEPKQLQYYIIKGIEKPSSNSPTQTIYLPQRIPYMVELIAFFQNEQKIFLLLQLASGGQLLDYIHSYKTDGVPNLSSFDKLFPAVNNERCMGVESTHLANDVDEIVENSKKLLQSVSNTLTQIEQSSEVKQSPKKTSDLSLNTQTKLPETCIKQWARELLIAIHSLHIKGVILGDLNVYNLLLGDEGQLLLTYFYKNDGMHSDSYVEKTSSVWAIENHFVAPERPLRFKSDWWSYGVILYELLVGVPFKLTHPGRIDLYGVIQYPENVDLTVAACDLLENLLKQTIEERFEYEQIKEHSFFEGTNWDEIEKNGHKSSHNPNTTTQPF